MGVKNKSNLIWKRFGSLEKSFTFAAAYRGKGITKKVEFK